MINEYMEMFRNMSLVGELLAVVCLLAFCLFMILKINDTLKIKFSATKTEGRR